MAKKKTEQIDLPLAVSETQVEVGITSLELEKVVASPNILRSEEDAAAVADLAASMSLDGLLHPIAVRMLPPDKGNGGNTRYEVIAGHRRLAAARELGWQRIPVRVLTGVDDDASFRLSLLENLKRVDLNPMEEAESFNLALTVLAWREAKLAKAINRSPAYVKGRLALLQMAEPLRELVQDGVSPAKAQALAPLAQLPNAAAVIAEFNLENPLDTIQETAERALQRRTVPIKGWDPEICKAAGCLGEVKRKAVCLNPSHAFAMVIAAHAEELSKTLESYRKKETVPAGLSADLPVYYSLDELAPVKSYDRHDTLQPPAEFPACPQPLAEYWNWQRAGALPWESLKKVVKGKAFDAKCLSCPAWTGKGPGRALLVAMDRVNYPSYTLKPAATILCMSAGCRVKQAAATGKQPETAAADDTKERQKAAERVVLAAHAEEIEKKLLKDPLRTLTAFLMHRYRMSELPVLHYKWAGVCDALGIKRPAHDDTANGALKALMGVGKDDLYRLMAAYVVRRFDQAEDYSGWHVNPLVATTAFLFGPEAAAELKEKARLARKAAASSPDLTEPLKQSVRRARRPAIVREAEAAEAEPEPEPEPGPAADPAPTSFKLLDDGRAFCSACMNAFDVDDRFRQSGRCPEGHAPDGSEETE